MLCPFCAQGVLCTPAIRAEEIGVPGTPYPCGAAIAHGSIGDRQGIYGSGS
jgi:hypothetical protein